MRSRCVTSSGSSATVVLTRRQTLWGMAGMAALPTFLSLGCGGGGGGGSSSLALHSAHTTSSLPSGLSIPMAELKGETAFGSSTVAPDGSFGAQVRQTGGPTLTWLRHTKTNKFVLFGFAGEGQNGISAHGSAVAILALALGIGGLAPVASRQLVSLIEANPATTTLASVIEARVGASPYALTDGDAAIQTAVQAAVAAISGSPAPKSETNTSTRGRDEVAPLLSITPGDQSGSNVIQKTEPATTYAVNNSRRPAAVYTYLTGYTTDSGDTNLSTAQAFGTVQDLIPTTSLLGSLASLGARPAYAPVENPGIKLDLYTNSKKTKYDTVILMASGKTDSEGEPSFFSDPKYAAVVPAWRTKRQELNKHAWIGGIVFDIVASVVGGVSVWLSYTAVLAAIAEIEATGAAASAAVIQAASGGYLTATFTTLSQAVGSADIALKVQAALARIVLSAEGAATDAIATQTLVAIGGVCALVVGTLAVAGSLLALADLGFTYKDVLTSEKGALWTDTLLKPNLGINPASSTIAPGARTTLTAATVGALIGDYRFHWKLTGGGNGTLSDTAGGAGAGRQLDTTGPAIDLVTAPSDLDGAVYTITVEAFNKKTNASFGTATASVTLKASGVQTVPGTFQTYYNTGSAGSDGRTPMEAIAAVHFSPPPGTTTYSIQYTYKNPDGTVGGPFAFGGQQQGPDYQTVYAGLLKNTVRGLVIGGSYTDIASALATAHKQLDAYAGDTFEVVCY